MGIEMKSLYKGIKIAGKKTDEHRLVWERAYGPIPEGMVIHHKNYNKHDNSLSNLELLTYEEHNEIHETYKNFFVDKESWLKNLHTRSRAMSKDKGGLFWCNSCKKNLPRDDFSKNKSRLSGLQNRCKRCRSEDRRIL